MIDYGATIEAKMHSGATSLVIASQKGFREIVQILLNNNADTSPSGGLGYNSLHLATMDGH